MAKIFKAGTGDAVVQTKSGLIRGFYFDGIYRFHGIKYATAERFMPPKAVEPWEGVKDAQAFGHVAPLMSPNSPNADLLIPHRFWPESEDCLYLNVWSTKLCPEAKKPVMVWLHGGGYSAGSSVEMIAYDGDNMAKYGDVVCVTINHRLNMLGYFDLSSFGEAYANSGNAGHADMVEALKWVKDNIQNFGGDPDNVTLFGQSGGGMKIQDLLQIPAADGLFHKGIVMSGVAGTGEPKPRYDKEIAEMLIAALGGEDVSILSEVPVDELFKAFTKIQPELEAKGMGGRMMWGPVANGWYLGDGRIVGFNENSKQVPLMVGSVIAEMGFAANVPDKNDVPASERRAMIAGKYGEDVADKLIAEFKKVYPDKNELVLMGMSSRLSGLSLVQKRAEDGSPAYNYLFTYDFPYNGGMPAWHCSDIPFAFHNAERIAICNEGAGSDNLENAYFGAYMAFAHTGSPNGRGLAKWPAYTPDCKATMFFDVVSEAKIDADKDLRELFASVAANPFAAPAPQKPEEKITF